MLVVGAKVTQKDVRPLAERLHHLQTLLRAEQGAVLLGGWAQDVLQDAHRAVAAAALADLPHGALALQIIEGLGLWGQLKGDSPAATLGLAGPVDPQAAANDVRAIIELLGPTEELGKRGPRSQSGKHRRGRLGDNREALRILVREIYKELVQKGCDRDLHKEICRRLANHPLPSSVNWGDCSWPKALERHTKAVRTWLSKAIHGV